MDTKNGAAPAILVIDEHGVYRRGLRALIEANIVPGQVIEAAVVDSVNRFVPFDLILIDVGGLQSTDFMKDVRQRHPQTRVAAMSISNNRSDVLNCLAAGFHGFIFKLQPQSQFLAAVQDLLSGRIYVPRWPAEPHEPSAGLPQSVNVQAERPQPPACRE
jgi:DNA-binding NarL/FixJ family response regulator